MKKAILLAITLSLFLSSCGKKAESTEAVQGADVPTFDEVALGAAEQRAEYYREQAAELEKENLALKATLYEERATYEARIDALEASLYPEVAEALFEYSVSNGRATVTRYIGSGNVVVIPATLDGVPVTEIADRAFENNTTLTSVTIPDGVTHIGWFAFSGCIKLEGVTLPASLTSVEYGAFLNCPATLTVYCPADSYAERYAQSYGFAVKAG